MDAEQQRNSPRFEEMFKSEAQMRHDRLLSMIEGKLPEEAKARLLTPEGIQEFQNNFIRILAAMADKTRAEELLVSKMLGLEKITLSDFNFALTIIAQAIAAGVQVPRETIADFDRGLFFFLKFTETRDLYVRQLSHRLHLAAQENDQNFLRRLGRELGVKSKPLEFRAPDRLDFFLWNNWIAIEGTDPAIGLCHFLDPALLAFCKIQLENKNLSQEALTARRSRLGLRKSRHSLIRGVKPEKDGGIRLIRV